MAAMSSRLPFLAAVLLLASSGCKDREITAYRAPKDPVLTAPAPAGMANTNDLPRGHPPVGATSAPAEGNMAGTAVPTGTSELAWTAPAGWEAKATGPMRRGSFAIKGENGAAADLSITAFPGDTGGLLANLNRWRSQVGLPPLDAAALPAQVVHVDSGNLHFEVVDFAGTSGGTSTRILGAILPYKGETWFFKLMGPDVLVAREKPAFLEFLHTVSPR
jgi:hypothetical protein